MPSHLFDTNCFYAISANRKKREHLRALDNPVSTSIIAPLEILRISDDAKDFRKRKSAMEALDYVRANILLESPDSIIRRSFGLPPEESPIPLAPMIRALLLASSYHEAVSGVTDIQNAQIIKLHPTKIKEWKSDLSSFFTEAVVAGNKQMLQIFLEQLKKLYPEVTERDLKLVSKELTAHSSQKEHSKRNALVGLATRVGLFTVEQLTDALIHDKMNALLDQAFAKYNGLIDPYVTMYLAFQKQMSDGRTPERNALFDLEFFTHLNAHDKEYIFVTTEPFWIEQGKQHLPGRVVTLDSLFQ